MHNVICTIRIYNFAGDNTQKATKDQKDADTEQSIEEDIEIVSENEDEDIYVYSDDFEDLESGEESDIEDNDIPNPGDMDLIIERMRDPNPELPETVTVLEGEHGSKVYLVGTAHFSEESQQDVRQVSNLMEQVLYLFETNVLAHHYY